LVFFVRVAFHRKEVGLSTAWPDHGRSLAARTISNTSCDLNVDALGDDDMAWADMAFISAMAVQRKSAVHVVDRCKAKG
jgi:hypothetical protein